MLLEELTFYDCSKISAEAWQKLHGAKWLNLKKADFRLCLAERNGWRFSCFFSAFLYLFVMSLLDVVRVQVCMDLWSCRMSWSWPGWVLDGMYTCTYRCLNVFLTAGFWQNTAGASAITFKRCSCCIILRRKSWKISICASQREMVECFLVFFQRLFVYIGCCPSSDLYRSVKLSYELELTWMGFRWNVYLHLL